MKNLSRESADQQVALEQIFELASQNIEPTVAEMGLKVAVAGAIAAGWYGATRNLYQSLLCYAVLFTFLSAVSVRRLYQRRFLKDCEDRIIRIVEQEHKRVCFWQKKKNYQHLKNFYPHCFQQEKQFSSFVHASSISLLFFAVADISIFFLSATSDLKSASFYNTNLANLPITAICLFGSVSTGLFYQLMLNQQDLYRNALTLLNFILHRK